MPEEILHHRGPIATVPWQSMQAARIQTLRQSLSRKRKDSAKAEIQLLLTQAERELEEWRKANGR